MNSDDNTTKLSISSANSLAAVPPRYEIKSLVGQGGMGMVFQAYDISLQRDVAVKVLLFEGSRETELQQRFLREARALDALQNHPNIVNIYSSGLNSQGNPYHVMEFLEGQTLSQDLQNGALSATQFFAIFAQIIDGLQFAHNANIVHRDLKPSNIMHCRDNNGNDVYKIIDFGIARFDTATEGDVAKTSTLTRTNSIMGSPAYCSPEQCRGEKASYPSDIYSLGCIMFECISGSVPFRGETALETMYMHMTGKVLRLDGLTKTEQSKRLAELVDRCLRKEPGDRPQSLDEIKKELKQIHADGVDKLDLFSKTGKLPRKNALLKFIVVPPAAVLASAPVYLSQQGHKNSSAEVLPTKVSAQQRLSAKIKRMNAKLACWKNVSKTTDATQRKHYVSDLFAVGRCLLQSTDPADIRSAEQLFTNAISSCELDDAELQKRKISSFVYRAKARWKLNEFAESSADFNTALTLNSQRGVRQEEAFVDIVLERALLEIHLRQYADAYKDFDIAVQSFGKGRHKVGVLVMPSQLTRFNQTLDPLGDDRCKMIGNIADELLTMQARNSHEASDMLALANYVALTLSRINEVTKARTVLNFSNKLIRFVPDKAKQRALLEKLRQDVGR